MLHKYALIKKLSNYKDCQSIEKCHKINIFQLNKNNINIQKIKKPHKQNRQQTLIMKSIIINLNKIILKRFLCNR